MMKKLVTTLLLGSLITSCNLQSDPTKGTKFNHTNGSHNIDTSNDDIKQKSVGECNKLFNVQIQKVYNFEPGQKLSEVLVAHTLIDGMDSQLAIIPSEKNPKGLSIISGQERGEHHISWDTSKVNTQRNYEIFHITVKHSIKNAKQTLSDQCQINNIHEIKLVMNTETKIIPIKINKNDISDTGIVELEIKPDLNAKNSFEIQLPKISSVHQDYLSESTDAEDLNEFTEITSSNFKTGLYKYTINTDALAEKYKGQEEKTFALSLTAISTGSHAETFQVHFNYKSPLNNIEPIEKKDEEKPEGK